MNAAWGASDCHVCPGASCDDGLLHLLLVRRCGRLRMAPVLLGLEDGSHCTSKAVQILKVGDVGVTDTCGRPTVGPYGRYEGQPTPSARSSAPRTEPNAKCVLPPCCVELRAPCTNH